MAKAQYIEMFPRELAGKLVEICRKRAGEFSVDSALKKRFWAVMDRAFGTPSLKEYAKRVFFDSRKSSKLLPKYLGINLRRREWGVFDPEKVKEIETELLFYLSTQGTLSSEDLDYWREQIRVFYGPPESGQVIPFKRPVRRQRK